MSLPSFQSELGHHFGLGASFAAGDRWTSGQIFALRDECVFEQHRFRPAPVFPIRSNGTATIQPQLIRSCGDFLFSWVNNSGDFHGLADGAHFTHHLCCMACHGRFPSSRALSRNGWVSRIQHSGFLGPAGLFWVRVGGPTKSCRCETQGNIEALLPSASHSKSYGVWFTSREQRTCMPQLKSPHIRSDRSL